MKVDRVVFCLNTSPLYSGMWDIVSKVYAKKTNLIPTLIFVGTQEEADREIKENYGEVYVLPRHDEFIVRKDLDWTVSWTLHWAVANMFPDDVCQSSGIDEIPCDDTMEKLCAQIPEGKYFFPLGPDPYGIKIVANGYGTGKGSDIKRILGIKDDLKEELARIWSKKDEFCSRVPQNHIDVRNRGWWGMDEAYISSVVYGHPDVVFLSQESAKAILNNRRIARNKGCTYDKEALKKGHYWSCHMVRPLSDPKNKKIIDQLIEDLGV